MTDSPREMGQARNEKSPDAMTMERFPWALGNRRGGPLTAAQLPWQDSRMPATQQQPTADQIEADAQAVIEHAMTGQPLDPEVYRRVRERSERAT